MGEMLMITIKDYEMVIDEARELVARKNADYAGEKDFLANFRMAKMMGLKPSQGVLLRMSDKFSRVCQLTQKDAAVPEEKIHDTLVDLLNYAALMILCLKDEAEEEERGG